MIQRVILIFYQMSLSQSKSTILRESKIFDFSTFYDEQFSLQNVIKKGDYWYPYQSRLDTRLASIALIDTFLSNINDLNIPIFDSNTISFSNDTSLLVKIDKIYKHTGLFSRGVGFLFFVFALSQMHTILTIEVLIVR